MDDVTESTLEEQPFLAFRSARSAQEMFGLAATLSEDELDALERDAQDRLAAAEGDEAQAWQAMVQWTHRRQP